MLHIILRGSYNRRKYDNTSRSPLPVTISIVIADANPTIAKRPSHTSKLLLSFFVLCSALMETDIALDLDLLWLEVLWTTEYKINQLIIFFFFFCRKYQIITWFIYWIEINDIVSQIFEAVLWEPHITV